MSRNNLALLLNLNGGPLPCLGLNSHLDFSLDSFFTSKFVRNINKAYLILDFRFAQWIVQLWWTKQDFHFKNVVLSLGGWLLLDQGLTWDEIRYCHSALFWLNQAYCLMLYSHLYFFPILFVFLMPSDKVIFLEYWETSTVQLTHVLLYL